MIRSSLVASFLLLAFWLDTSVAIGQEPPKAEPPAPKPASQVAEVERDRLRAEAAEARARADLSAEQKRAESMDLANQRVLDFHEAVEAQVRAVATVHDALETSFGLRLSEADDTLRAQLEISGGQGVVVVGVKGGSLAEQAGLKVNDVLMNLGGQDAKGVEQVRKTLLEIGKEALEVKLIREGKPSRMKLVGPEHGFPAEAAEYWIGVPVSPVDPTLRAHLPGLPADSGLIVNDVVKGSPADQVAVKKDDILVSMDGQPLKNSAALIARIQSAQGKPVPLQVLRAGKPISITITPAKRAHPTVITTRREYSVSPSVKYQVVQPYMAIEVDPKSKAIANPPAPQPLQEKNVEFKLYNPTQTLPGNDTTMFLGVYQPQSTVESPTARIEVQLKEVVAKLDEIAKAVEALKKSAEKK